MEKMLQHVFLFGRRSGFQQPTPAEVDLALHAIRRQHLISNQVVVRPARVLASSRVIITAEAPEMAASPSPASAPNTNLSPQSPTEPMITFGAKVYPAPVSPTLSFINDWQPFAVRYLPDRDPGRSRIRSR